MIDQPEDERDTLILKSFLPVVAKQVSPHLLIFGINSKLPGHVGRLFIRSGSCICIFAIRPKGNHVVGVGCVKRLNLLFALLISRNTSQDDKSFSLWLFLGAGDTLKINRCRNPHQEGGPTEQNDPAEAAKLPDVISGL